MTWIWLGFGEVDLFFRSIQAEIANWDEIGLKNRPNSAQRLQMGSLWLISVKIDLFFRSNLAEIANWDEIGLKNRPNLALWLQMSSLWLGYKI